MVRVVVGVLLGVSVGMLVGVSVGVLLGVLVGGIGVLVGVGVKATGARATPRKALFVVAVAIVLALPDTVLL